MSIAEMKLAAINQIKKIEDEQELQEILAHIKKISSQKSSSLNLSQHYNTINRQYANVLKKLAQ